MGISELGDTADMPAYVAPPRRVIAMPAPFVLPSSAEEYRRVRRMMQLTAIVGNRMHPASVWAEEREAARA